MPHRPRLLLVSYHFPPSESVGARRPGALAEFAAAHGWEVRVLAGPPPSAAPPRAESDHLAIIRCRGWWPERLPAMAEDPAPAGTAAAGDPSGAGAGRLRRWAREVVLVPDRQSGWIVPAARSHEGRTAGWRPDVIVASGPPFSGFVVASRLARRYAVPWIADYRDLWTVGNEYWPYGRSGWRRRFDRWLEERLVRSAHLCVTVSEPLAETLRDTFGMPTRVVMNGIDRRPPVRRLWPEATAGTAPELTLVHTGISYPGRRDPWPLLRAMARLGADCHRVRLVLAGVGSEDYRPLAEAAGVAERVTILGRVTAAESWRLQSEADVLVLLSWNDRRDAGNVTGKIFDYLQARHPILMLGYPDGVAGRMIRDRGAGVVRNDPDGILAALRGWLATKDRAGSLPQLPEAALAGLYREDQLRTFLNLLPRPPVQVVATPLWPPIGRT